MVKKFVFSTTLTSKLPSTAFTPVKKTMALRNSPTNQAITQRNTQNIRINNRAVPLNPKFKGKPRAGNFGTKRLAGL